MADQTQRDKPIQVQTPLGEDILLITKFSGQEGISQLFEYTVDMYAENHRNVAFDKILGQKSSIVLLLPGKEKRYINGIVNSFSRLARGPYFTEFRMTLVPQFWLLTHAQQCRIFQRMTVPDILKKVLADVDFSMEVQGKYERREYCVQYRETDFDFASRLMEEEGIYYFFKHTSDGHKMVLADSPQSHPDLEMQSKIVYDELEGGLRDDMRITGWEKLQELQTAKYTLWDHKFELPHRHLEADKMTLDSVQVGRASHKLKLGANSKLEMYDHPGGYSKRYDGIDKSGGEQPAELQKIFEDNKRTTNIRMQQEEVDAIRIQARSNCRHMVSGYKFNLDRHYGDNGSYVVTSVQHHGSHGETFRAAAEPGEFSYENHFTCIPAAVPFRPKRVVPKPVVHGSQTAVVVGPSGEEIFTDKYGRIKVQFHWDREGKNDADSSCWVRVAWNWAGKQWGAISIPRIGQEVVVDFMEGDPDRPIVVGSVYNPDQMPPYKLPDNKTVSTLKSRSSKGGGQSNYNEIRMEDKKGKEQLFIHGEKNLDLRVKEEYREWVGKNRHIIVKESRTETVEKHTNVTVKGNVIQKTDGNVSVNIGGNRDEKVGSKWAAEAGQEIHLKAGMKVVIEGGTELTIKSAGGFVKIDPAGVTIQGTMVKINSGGAPGTGSGASPQSPPATDVADDGSKFDKL